MAKVLHIGFGLYPFWKGGMVNYQDSLMEGLSASGWEVVFFAGGRYTLEFFPALKERKVRGIKVIELVNSPNLPFPNNNPLGQCRNRKIENLTKKVLDREKPDIIHLHDLRMHCASIIDLILERKIPVVKTIHNYYDFCPQGELMYRLEIPCQDYEKGRRCLNCVPLLKGREVSLQERVYNSTYFWNNSIRKVLRFSYHLFRPLFISKGKKCKSKVAPVSLSSDIYQQRREFFIERLNKLDAIHCYSHGSADVLVRLGIEPRKIVVIPVSAKSLELIIPHPLRDDSLPVVFGYLGTAAVHKGFYCLLEAFSKLDQTKAKLLLVGNRERVPEKFKDLSIEYYDGFSLKDLNKILSRIDVGIVPSLWEEIFGIVGIEFLQARIPVIASRIGGIPEWLKDGSNGFLVEPGNPEELAEKMKLFIDNPALIREIQERIKPWKSMVTHVQEMIGLYKRVLKERL